MGVKYFAHFPLSYCKEKTWLRRGGVVRGAQGGPTLLPFIPETLSFVRFLAKILLEFCWLKEESKVLTPVPEHRD